MRREVVGGPADGATVAAAAGPFRWIHATGRSFLQPRPGCGLYRIYHGHWRFQGSECWECAKCGAVVLQRTVECPLCGAERKQRVEEGLDGG